MPGSNFFIFLRRFDWLLLVSVVILVAFGMVAIYSLSVTNEAKDFTKFNKQLIVFAAGLILLFFFAYFDYRFLRTYSLILYFIALLGMILVLWFGSNIRGSTSWFEFFGLTFQPVELSKIALIIFLSRFFTIHYQAMHEFKRILVSALVTLPFVALTILQPDFGSAIILLIIWLGMLLLNNIKRGHVLIIVLAIIVVMLFSWFFVLKDYQKERIITFFNPSRDPLGSGYNPIQSIVAVGSGQLFGRGLGLGPQSQLNFLPVQEKDFIFAVISEELGFVGASLIFLFFILMFFRFFRAMKKCTETFSFFMIAGIILSLFSQAFINIAMNIGLLPITGVPLPFVSYGGSSLISSMIMIGLSISVIIRQRV